MSLHSSLKRAERMAASRSVMTRTERIKWLQEKGAWTEQDRVLGLPKIKVIKLKTVKKEKTKEAAVDGEAAKKADVDTGNKPAATAQDKKKG